MDKSSFWLIQLLPFAKRLFFWNDSLYFLFNYMPAVIALRSRINTRIVPIYIIIFGLFAAGLINAEGTLLYTVGLIPLLCSSQFDFDFSEIFQRYWYLPVIVVAYGVYQKIFGYTFFELGWIQSARGRVGAEGLFLADDIRPFSAFAGIPEFSFFLCILIYHEIFVRKKILTSLVVTGVLLMMGSRGVITGFIVALFAAFLGGRLPKPARFIGGLLAGVIIYAGLVFAGDFFRAFEPESGDDRMLVYGTFNARYEIVSTFLGGASPSQFLFGVHLPYRTFDNMYISILNDFGVFGLIVLFSMLYAGYRDHKSEFAVCVAMTFGLYSEFAHSFFFMHLMAMAIYSKLDVKQLVCKPQGEAGFDKPVERTT